MAKLLRLTHILVMIVLLLSVAACGDQVATPSPVAVPAQATATTGATVATAATEVGDQPTPTVARSADTPTAAVQQGGDVTMTDVGTPRNETLIFQTFDGKTNDADQMNPLMGNYAIWRGFRELAWGYLWEMDTATGQSYPELAAELPKRLNDQYTQFEVKLKKGIYWSDGVEFTADDVIYTLDTYFQQKDKLTYFGVSVLTNYIKSYKKVDQYTLTIETLKPAYDFVTTVGVYTWGSALNIVPKHIFEKQADLAAFRNTKPVTLGPYTVKEFDPNGFWQLWERRADWQRSAWGWMGEPKPKYVLYKDFGTEQTRSLAFTRNQYDIDSYMSPDSIQAAQAMNPAITTFSPVLPYHDMSDACAYAVLLNKGKAPLDKLEVRWALTLATDLQSVGINAVNGQFRPTALGVIDSPILRPIYHQPLQQWLKDFKLADGYQPYNPNFAQDLVNRLKEMGMDESKLPQGEEAIAASFGLGWWKSDVAEVEKLMNSVGMKKNSDGFFTMPDGQVWELEFVVPGEWNKGMQRIGFSIADSWTKAGFKVNTRQVDAGEHGAIAANNSLLTAELQGPSCVFTTNYLNSFRSISAANVKPGDSTEPLNGNLFRVTDEEVFSLIERASSMDVQSEEFYEIGREVLKKMVENMDLITIMNIPTTIPTNSTYWTNYPKADNFYAVPYTWWSSAKKIVLNVEPTGHK